jgi:transposase-like protein
MEEKIISMYAKGMTTADIESHMHELYDIEISDSTISRITDKIQPIVKEWQECPLEEILIACVDGLTGFPQAIKAAFPKTEIQQCIIHQIRNTTKFVSYKDINGGFEVHLCCANGRNCTCRVKQF